MILENTRHEMRSPAQRLVEALSRAANAREWSRTFAEYEALQPFVRSPVGMLRIGPPFRDVPAHLRIRLLEADPKTYDRLARASGVWS